MRAFNHRVPLARRASWALTVPAAWDSSHILNIVCSIQVPAHFFLCKMPVKGVLSNGKINKVVHISCLDNISLEVFVVTRYWKISPEQAVAVWEMTVWSGPNG